MQKPNWDAQIAHLGNAVIETMKSGAIPADTSVHFAAEAQEHEPDQNRRTKICRAVEKYIQSSRQLAEAA